jgi:hypothetical protein
MHVYVYDNDDNNNINLYVVMYNNDTIIITIIM